MQIDFSNINVQEKQSWLNGAIAPRPIGLISTIDRDGVANLAPFSFFNVVSMDPAVLIFSPLRRVRDNTAKHTVLNVRDHAECVIHIVTYPIARQINLTACEYPETVDEFIKAGFTKEKAIKVKPWMIKECPIKFECKIKEMREMGNKGGSGTICYAEVVMMHVDESALGASNVVDPCKLQQVARLGEDHYIRVTKEGLFQMPKPNRHLGIGFDGLPEQILSSKILSANDLGQLAMVDQIPAIDDNFSHIATGYAMEQPIGLVRTTIMHKIASKLLELGLVSDAWQVLLRVELGRAPTLERNELTFKES